MAYQVNLGWTRNGATPLFDNGNKGGGRPIDVPAAFTPLLTDDFNSGALDTTRAGFVSGRAQYNNEQAFAGSQSLKISFLSGMGPPTCGGSGTFGGKFTVQDPVTKGYSLWFRMRLYMPSTLSFGYIYGQGDEADAAECGGAEVDGFGRNKLIVIEQNLDSTARMYLQPSSPRRSVTRGSLLRIDTDLGPSEAYAGDNTLPADQWFSLQMQLYAHETDGFYRTWIDDRYVGQVNGATLSSAAHALEKFGFGTYWNGTHYTDGSAGRSDFWVDDVVAATDMPGYEAPTGTDASGNTYIDPATTVASLA